MLQFGTYLVSVWLTWEFCVKVLGTFEVSVIEVELRCHSFGDMSSQCNRSQSEVLEFGDMSSQCTQS